MTPFRPLSERFWEKVEITETCWLWTGALNKKGYGLIGVEGIARLAHRVGLTLLGVQLVDGKVVDHTCLVHRCINPDHLDQVTQQENVLRSAQRGNSHWGRKTHCPSGHPYDEVNTRIYRGHRYCRACQRGERVA